MKEQEKEIRYSFHVTFLDGRHLLMSDTLDSIIECLEKWSDIVEYCYLEKI